MGKLPIRRSKASDRSTASPVVLASSPPVSAALRKAVPGKVQGPSVRRAALLGHSVQRVASGLVQTKLTVGPVGDSYEREADSVAAQVVSAIHSPSPAPAEAPGGEAGGPAAAESAAPAMTAQRAMPEDELKKKPLAGAVQRTSPEDELKKKPLAGSVQRSGPEDELKMKPLSGAVQRTSPEDELKKKPLAGAVQRNAPEDELKKKPLAGTVQREGGSMAGAEGGPVSGDLERSIEGARSGGSALDPGLRSQMEPAFGADFSGVRVHSDSKAHSLNNSLQARAFTTGQDIFFRGGEYNPTSQSGQELVAHELTHVVQQNGPGTAKKG